jgi:hypothetical protein
MKRLLSVICMLGMVARPWHRSEAWLPAGRLRSPSIYLIRQLFKTEQLPFSYRPMVGGRGRPPSR